MTSRPGSGQAETRGAYPGRAVLHCGDALDVLTTLPSESVRCCVTSPPYWGLRDYGVAGQLGLEKTPDEYVAKMVAVFREVRRVLAVDGTLWLNIGDSYVRKILAGIPWRLAFALANDGWLLRCDVIWEKPHLMPESVMDRPTRSHEYLFLLAKSPRYFYNGASIREPDAGLDHPRATWTTPDPSGGVASPHTGIRTANGRNGLGRNARSIWRIATQPFVGEHTAAFPEELARRCIVAGSAPGDVVLDPFGGSGTVAQVATGNGRSSVYIDLNPKYRDLAQQRIGPMLCESVA